MSQFWWESLNHTEEKIISNQITPIFCTKWLHNFVSQHTCNWTRAFMSLKVKLFFPRSFTVMCCKKNYLFNWKTTRPLDLFGQEFTELIVKTLWSSVKLEPCYLPHMPCRILIINWHTDPYHLISGTYFTWHSLLPPSAPRSKRPIRPLRIAFPIQQLGSSLFPVFLSSTAQPHCC